MKHLRVNVSAVSLKAHASGLHVLTQPDWMHMSYLLDSCVASGPDPNQTSGAAYRSSTTVKPWTS